jgi:cell division protein FtsB
MTQSAPPTPSPQPNHPPDRSNRRWTLAEKVLTIFAALITVVSGVLGVQAAQISKEKEQLASSDQAKSQDLGSLQARLDQLNAENDSLRAENEAFRERAGLPGPTSRPQSSAGSSIRHAGQLTLAAGGSGVDLDSPSTDPQWGSPASYTGDGDLDYNGREFTVAFYGEYLLLGSEPADYDSCRRPGYQGGSFAVDEILVGEFVCEKTGDKRIAAIRLVELDSSKATFDVVTYDPPQTQLASLSRDAIHRQTEFRDQAAASPSLMNSLRYLEAARVAGGWAARGREAG